MHDHLPLNPIDLASASFAADPYPSYRRYLAELPVCWDEPHQTWLISRYDDIHAALRDHRFSSDRLDSLMDRLEPADRAAAAPLRQILTNRLLLSNNPVHHRVRGLIQQAFTPRRVEAMRSFITATAETLLARVATAGKMDLIANFADPLPSRVITAILGLPAEDRHRFKAWTDDIYAFLGVSSTPLVERAQQATSSARELSEYLAGVFAEIRMRPRDDLLSAMVTAEAEGNRLTEIDLFSNVVGIINGSHETTANLIANTILTLLRHPDQLARLRQDESLLDGTIEECLRYESPVQMMGRLAAEDMCVAGVRIAVGERVAFLIAAANRDPSHFSEPDHFDISRASNSHLAFGGGPHFCIGASLGRVEAQISVAAIVKRFPTLRLTSDEVQWRPYPVFRALKALHLEW